MFRSTILATYAFIVLSASAQVEPIPGLVPTGAGDMLSLGDPEPNYTGDGLIIVAQIPGYATPPFGSTWIAQTPTNVSDPPSSIFSASLAFDLTGFDHTTATIVGTAAGDDGVFVDLNDGPTTFVAGAVIPGNFSITDGFIPGVNIIRFSVGNSDALGFNPSALLVGSLGGTAMVAPPDELPCNDADIAEPFGALDTDDVLTAIDQLANDASEADFDDSGSLDFFDMVTFLEAFDADCP